MTFCDVGIQFHAEPGFFAHLDESVLNVRSIKLQQLAHPAALPGNGFAGEVIGAGAEAVSVSAVSEAERS